MSLIRTLSVASVLVVALSSVVGCSSTSSEPVVLKGRLGAGSSSTTTKSFGGLTGTETGLRVAARKLHRRGEVGATVDVLVAPDGSFALDVPSGSRWVLTVDGSADKSAIFAWDAGKTVLDATQAAAGEIDLGAVRLLGGQATVEGAIEGKAGVRAALAEAEDVFESAQGALVEARAAVEEARVAAENAKKEADGARAAAEKARKEAEDAAKNLPGVPSLPGT